MAVAVVLHAVGFALLCLLPGQPPVAAVAADPRPGVWFRLAAVPEGASTMFLPINFGMELPAGMGGPLTAGRRDDLQNPGAWKEPVDDAELAEILAADREALLAELNQKTQQAGATPAPAVPLDELRAAKAPSGGNGTRKAPEGAIRELDLTGFPQPVVDEVMERHRLRVVQQDVRAGRRGQSFLSSAVRGVGERYFGGMDVPEGVYDVFQLNRETVATMSRLEENALKEQGFQPLQARVIRIVFGIVKASDGTYDLGVKLLEAEKVSL